MWVCMCICIFKCIKHEEKWIDILYMWVFSCYPKWPRLKFWPFFMVRAEICILNVWEYNWMDWTSMSFLIYSVVKWSKEGKILFINMSLASRILNSITFIFFYNIKRALCEVFIFILSCSNRTNKYWENTLVCVFCFGLECNSPGFKFPVDQG